jgi:hypothetical protein
MNFKIGEKLFVERIANETATAQNQNPLLFYFLSH